MSRREVTVRVYPDGRVVMIHDDDFPLGDLAGVVRIRRASDVEPAEDNRWTADMSRLGPEHVSVKLEGFSRRDEALAAERAYIEACLEGRK